MSEVARRAALADGRDPLGDVLGEVADALEVGRHADRADHGAQVLRHRLALGDQRDGRLVQRTLARVHRLVVGDDALGERVVGADQRAGGGGHHRAGELAHLADQPVDMGEVLVEGTDGVLAVHWSCAPDALSRSGR